MVRSYAGNTTWRHFLMGIIWEDKDSWDNTTYEVLNYVSDVAKNEESDSTNPVEWSVSIGFAYLINPDGTTCCFNEIVDSNVQYQAKSENL